MMICGWKRTADTAHLQHLCKDDLHMAIRRPRGSGTAGGGRRRKSRCHQPKQDGSSIGRMEITRPHPSTPLHTP